MINFTSLSTTTAYKIISEIVRVIYNNSEILNYIKSGKAKHFGFDSEEELWDDRILFREHIDAKFVCCTDYIHTSEDKRRAERVIYILIKLRATFTDWEDEKVLEEVREFIRTFTNL